MILGNDIQKSIVAEITLKYSRGYICAILYTFLISITRTFNVLIQCWNTIMEQ